VEGIPSAAVFPHRATPSGRTRSFTPKAHIRSSAPLLP